MRMKFLRRKCFLFLLLMFAVGLQAMATESCGIVFNLHDSYGDGWNGNKLVVSDGNALNEELTFDNGSSASFTLIIAEGSHVTLSWIEGDYPEECTYSVRFENGYPIYDGESLIDSAYEFDLNCDDANTPVTITVASGNDEAGSVSGGGEFVCGEICTVTATPNEGYSFWCWVDEDENKAISTEANYTFTVSGPQVLLAAFRPVSNANNIVFADPNVENICLQQDWDTDNDGYLSYTEASAVTDLGGAFQWNPNITSFNELQYFTGLTSIGDQAFGGCSNLMSITLPNSVISIETNSFSACNGLEHIIVDTENPVYDSRDNCNAVIETSTNTLVVGCKNTNIPNTVTSIGDNAFANCTSLESITIPNSVTAIGDYAFVYCSSLTSVLIPNTVTSLGEAVFGACSDLEQITVEEGNPVYDSRDNCNAIIETSTNTLISGCQNTVIPNTVTSIGMEAFAANESLTAIAIPNSVTTIGDQAFVVCTNLTSLIIPSSVQSIGNSAFAGCTGLTSMIIFNTNVEMGDNVFDGVTVPEILFISASASPTDGGGLFGLSQGGGGSAFVGTLVNELSIEFAPQGSGEVPSNNPVLLMAKPNEGWQFVGWQINGELVSDEASLMFRAFGEFAFEAHFEPCGAEPEPELLSGRFSVSDCSTIGFARSNTIMSMSDLSMVEAVLFGVEIPGLHYEIGENQWDRMTYDASALNGNSEAYEELLLTGADILPSFMLKNNVDCWHIPTWREWDYMLNQRETASGIRFAYGIVNDVSGLIILPDDWEASTYNALSNVNEIGNYDNNVIDAETWTTVLEPAGAVFLPANGYIVQGALIQESSDGQAVGAYPGLLFSPNGDFMMGQIEGFPMTGPMTLMLDMVTMFGMMNSSNSSSFGGTSLRLAKLMESSTATITLATNGSERGTVSGAGEFACQQECTVTATANDGYVFMYWLEDGVAISHDPVYSFKLFGDRNLTAVFAPVDEVCQMIIETTAPSGASFLLEWFGMGLSMSFDDGTPPYHLPFGTTPESLDFLDIMQLMQSMQSGNTNTNYTHTINVIRGSNASLDIMISEDLINFMMASGDSISELGLTFNVRYSDGEALIENATELPYTFLCNCADITLFVDPEEGGEIIKEGELNIGESVTLTAVANEHYNFVNWTLNGVVVSSDPTYSFVVTAGGEMVAHFELSNYAIQASTNPSEGGTVTGAGTYAYGSECTLTAIPNEGYAFSAWIENGEVIATDNPYTFTVTSERSLEASFIYLLPMIADDFNDGIINQQLWMATGTHVVEEDGQLKLQQNVTDNYTALESQPLSVPVDNKIVINREFILHEQLHNSSWGNHYFYGNVNIKLNGSNDNYIGVCYYDDDYENRHGTYIRTQLNGEVTETRICDAIFDAWLTETVILDLSNELLTYILGENLISTISIPNLSSQQLNYYTVRFKPDGWWTGHYHNMNYVNISTEPNAVYTITAQGTPIGAGQVYGGGDFSLAEACTLTAIPSEGYAFSAWIENGETVSTDAVYGFTVTGERSLVAVFLPTYVITAEANNADYGTVTGGGTFMDGETCSLTATPNDGFGFVAWTEDGETVSTDAIYNFTVTSERNLVAVFLPTYEIAIVANDENYGSVTGGGTYVLNESCMVTATPAEGYHFVNWTENGDEVSTDAEYTFTVTNSRDLVANFALNYYDITAEAEHEEGGTVMGAGTYGHGSECTLTATANYGYHFVNWTLDGSVVSTEPNYTFTVISAGDYTANFQLNNYAINASANPSEGGSVSGTGNYDHGTDCTLTATANVGYTFVNWTLDGTEVGTDPTYTFTVYGDATYVANFSLNLYEITAITNPVEGGTITGAGNYYHGSGCTLTATPNEGYTFMYWSEGGNMVSYEANYSFVVTGDRALVAHFAANEQNLSLNPGWTWLSSYIEMDGIDGLGMLENGLNPNGVMIKSQRDGFVSYAGGMWIGTLDGITNEKMYLVNTNEASNVNFTGPVAQLNAHPITLNPNWTWLGYPVPFVVDINEALANLNASENDVVKSQSAFATYSTNDGWSGSLNQLTPGMGLMYQSHNSQPVTFNYGVGMSRALKANVTAEHNHWVPDIHAYPNNMSVMAVVELNGEELQDEGYELAVFNGSECRGSARLAYVPSLHRYVAFLTVTGENDVELYLALYDTMTGKAYYNTTDCPNFEANAVLGSLSMPFVARFGGTTDVDEWDAPNIELYPNPVVAGHLFQMEMPAECQGARVSIVNALGAVISTTNVYDEPITLRAPAVPGVYTVRIVTNKQSTFTRKLIVNK